MLRAGLVGVTGYTGMELSRILASHPSIRLTAATSRQDAGRRLDAVYPFLQGLPGADVTLIEPEVKTLAENCDVVFLAVPHGVAMEIGADLYDAGVKVVDLSADFRLRDAEVYEAWYKPHTRREYLAHAVYGLPEIYGDKVREARLVANPGCYPTASILGLYAALKNGLIRTDDIIIDAKSGTTGAGRKAVVSSLYCEVADSFRPYNLGKHRHTPEIEQELSRVAGGKRTGAFRGCGHVRHGVVQSSSSARQPGHSGHHLHEADESSCAGRRAGALRGFLEGQPVGPRAARRQTARNAQRARHHVLRHRRHRG